MADNLSPKVRSRIMSAIKGRDTKPEITVRSFLHKAGFRFKLHSANLPGRPDIVLPKWRAVVFVHGCFWHGHRCSQYRPALTRRKWWETKIKENRLRDSKNEIRLTVDGWRVFVVWECELTIKRLSMLSAEIRLC